MKLFSAMWCGSMDGSIDRSTTSIQTQISQLLLDGLPVNFVQTFLVLREIQDSYTLCPKDDIYGFECNIIWPKL